MTKIHYVTSLILRCNNSFKFRKNIEKKSHNYNYTLNMTSEINAN